LNATPKELIDRQIIMEMKQMLTTTDISIKELAAIFHFDTMSYMARFFRRHTGQNPNEFRKQ
jgi:YesN/AraC family two-component response regulator